MRGQDYIPRQITPSPVYPRRQVQVLSPAETFVQMANCEHPPLDLLHRSSSERHREKSKKIWTGYVCACACVCVCVCVYLCSRFHCLHIQPHTNRQELNPAVLLYSCSRGHTVTSLIVVIISKSHICVYVIRLCHSAPFLRFRNLHSLLGHSS